MFNPSEPIVCCTFNKMPDKESRVTVLTMPTDHSYFSLDERTVAWNIKELKLKDTTSYCYQSNAISIGKL